jgi:hypothetical protein
MIATALQCNSGKCRRMDDLDYLQRRERHERAAAKRAPSLAARLAHQEMAQRYAELIGPRSVAARDLRAA